MDRRQLTTLSVRVRPELRKALEIRADALGLRPADLYRVVLAAAATPGAGLSYSDAEKTPAEV